MKTNIVNYIVNFWLLQTKLRADIVMVEKNVITGGSKGEK